MHYLHCYYCMLILVTAIVTVNQLRILDRLMTNEQVIHSRLDYDAFRMMKFHPSLIRQAVEMKDGDWASYLAYETLARNYDLSDEMKMDQSVFSQIHKVENTDVYEELHYYYQMIFSDLKYFPVPEQKAGIDTVAFDNSWGAARTFGGDRHHEGTDIMAGKNKRGYYPIISVSDGVVEKKGWLPQGGYRIGVRSPHGGYFYYAHLFDYAPGLEEGTEVKAGQLLGFMGDSGYGEEGTVGQFAVHLHFGIYINSKEGEMSVNPYWILKYLEEHKLTCEY